MSLVKIVSPSGWNFDGPICSPIKVSSRGLVGEDRREFVKRAGASSSLFLDQLKNIKLAQDEYPVHMLGLGASEIWGCFAAGTPIALGDGSYSNIDLTQEGDVVLSADGNLCRVSHTFRRTVAAGLRVRVCGLLDDLQCSLDHPFRVARKEQFACVHDKYKRCLPQLQGQQNICNRVKHVRECVSAEYPDILTDWATAESLREGDFLVWTAPDIVPSFEFDVSEGYLIGAWLAEGNFLKDRRGIYGLELTLHAGEDDFSWQIMRSAFATNFDFSRYDKEHDSTQSLHLRGNPDRALLYWQLFGEYAARKRLPPWICCLPRRVRLSILAGYLDGDAHCAVSEKENRTTASTVSRDLCLGVQRLAWSLGIPAVVCPVHEGETCYHLSIANSYLKELEPLSYKVRGRALNQTSKIHGFFHRGRMYLPVRELVSIDTPFDVFNFEVEGDHTYSGPNVDSHNCNRNGDGFKKKACQEYHPTFVKFARLYQSHANKNPAKSYGLIKLSAYNPEMHRVELLAAYNATKEAAERNGGLVADRQIEKLASGNDLPISMAARVPFDVCNFCSNKAPSRDFYCTPSMCKAGGIKDNLGKLVKVGTDIIHMGVDNPYPTWFDMSDVWRPADRTAYGFNADWFTKAASDGGYFPAMEAATLASTMTAPLDVVLHQAERFINDWRPTIGYQIKLAYGLNQLAETPDFQLHEEGRRAFDPRMQPSVDWDSLIEPSVPELRHTKVANFLAALADEKIILPLREFAALTKQAETLDQTSLSGIYGRMLASGSLETKLLSNRYTLGDCVPGGREKRAAAQLRRDYSLGQSAVLTRCQLSQLRGHDVPARTHVKQAADAAPTALAEDYATYKLAALMRIAEEEAGFQFVCRAAIAQDQAACCS